MLFSPWQFDGNATTFNKTVVVGSVYQFTRYRGSPVVGRWTVRGHLTAVR